MTVQAKESVVSSDWLRVTLRRHWLALSISAIVGAAGAYGLSLLMKPAYLATVSLLPARDSGRDDLLSGLPAGVGGLASLAGVSLGGGGGNGAEAFEVLRSRALAREFIQREHLLEPLYAEMGKRETPEKALDWYLRRVLSVSEDKRTSVVTVSMTWTDRQLAADWANAYAQLANERLRARAVEDAAKRRAFLEKELERTQVLELREAAYRLIESQMKASMMATTRTDFAYQVFDPAVPADPDDRVRPKRGLLSAAGGVLALLLAFAVAALAGRRPGAD